MTVIRKWNETTQDWEVALVGQRGRIGPTGPTGPIGPTGSTGETGEQGIVVSSTPPDDTEVLWADVTESGRDAIQREARSDWVAPYSYIGIAAFGTTENSAGWKVTRIETINNNVSITKASPIAWSDRLTAVYS
jgi:hypothetical protein